MERKNDEFWKKEINLMRFFLFISLIIVATSSSWSQNSFLLLDKEQNLIFESEMINSADTFHSAIYPRQLKSLTNYDSIRTFLRKEKTGLGNFIFNDYPIEFANKSTRIIPLINFNIEKDFSGNPSPYTSGTGILLHSDIGEKLSFEFSFFGALQRFGVEDQRQIDSTGMLPHIGEYNAKINGAYSYTNWEGYLSYSPNRFLNFQIGKQKNFLGDGYRSLFLSDNSSSYPFVKAVVNAGKIQYIVLYQFMKDMDTQMYSYPNENK